MKFDDVTQAKIDQIIELTERSVDDICLALHECNDHLASTIEYLLDNPCLQVNIYVLYG